MSNKETIKELIKENLEQFLFYRETHVDTYKGRRMNCGFISCKECIIYKAKLLYKENMRCWKTFNKMIEVFNEFPEEDKLEMLIGVL